MFGLKRYESLIARLLEAGFVFSTNWNVNSQSRTVLMRHDIDFSVEDALAMAAFEEKLKIKSTYFFMLTSNMYNLLSKNSRDMVDKIKKMGHKISLHFDPTAYVTLDNFLHEREVFESVFGVDIDIVSIHRPGNFLDNNNIELFGVKQTYQDRFFKDFKYLSDSGGKDIIEPASDFIKLNQNQVLHLLIHPVWWMNESSSPTEVLNRWRSRRFEFVTEEIRANCKTYRG